MLLCEIFCLADPDQRIFEYRGNIDPKRVENLKKAVQVTTFDLGSDNHRSADVSWIDLYAGARFVTNNNEFRGHNQLSQDPLWVLTAHYSHKIGKQTWAGIGVHYDNGGQSFINHIAQHDYANGFRPAISIGRKLGKYSVTFRYENTASRPNAEPTNALLSLRFAGPV